jgi:hypothetical protein
MMMSFHSEQPHSRPRVAPADELGANLLTRANLLFFLSSPRLQRSVPQERSAVRDSRATSTWGLQRTVFAPWGEATGLGRWGRVVPGAAQIQP